MTDPRAHLPLKPVDLELLLSLAEEERHGYGLVQAVAERTQGLLVLDAGNLYRVIKRLLADGLVAESGQRAGVFFAVGGAFGSAGRLIKVSVYQATICFGSSGCGPKISVPCLPSLKPENVLRGLPAIARIHCISSGALASY